MNTSLPSPTIHIHEDQQALAQAAATALYSKVCELQASPQRTDNYVRLVLTGGGAGIATLEHLASLDHAAKESADSFPIQCIDWANVLIFFGDERFLPSSDAERNDLQAAQALLWHVDIPEENIFRYLSPTATGTAAEAELDAAATHYAEILAQHAPQGFDIHLLGMGPEGHINSLFPHRPELLHAKSLVVPVRDCPKPPPLRVSLSMDAINSADHVWLLVAGEGKQEAAQYVAERGDSAQWPAAGVHGRTETVLWVDKKAAPQGV